MGKHLTSVDDAPDVERLERFNSLEPGTYWRARKAVKTQRSHWGDPDTVEVGTVLLLLAVERFDRKDHTVVLREHPLEGDGRHKLLVVDFLAQFEPALDAEQVRAREMASLQKEIDDLQAELRDAQANPALMRPEIDKDLKDWEKAEQGRDRKPGKSKALAAPGATLCTDIASAVDKRLTAADTFAMRHLAAREAKLAELQAKWIEKRTGLIAEKLRAMTPFFTEKCDVALARTQNMRQLATDIMKGIESLDLYTGKGVEVEAIAAGQDATAGEPLTLLQRKLFMDEEFAAWAEVGEKFDFRDTEKFDKAIASNPSLRDQILPLPRCVVSMAVRRSDVDYGDRWKNNNFNEINRRVFLLVRNGDNIHRVYSAQPSHEHTPRLFPTRNELNNLFKGIDGRDITFRDVQFTDKAKVSENTALHYKRFLILLCGLDHRLGLFGRFYDDSAPGFITLEFQERFMRFVADDEPNSLLGENRESVFDWVKSKNAYLQSGSRVLCYYPELLTPATAPACRKEVPDRRGGYFTETLAEPLTRYETRIAHQEGPDICIDMPVKREYRRYHEEQRRPEFNARVSLTQAVKNEASRPGFLCLDAVTAADLEWYVYNRETRVQHIDYIRMFKLAAKALRAEEAQEAPSRAWLRKSIIDAGHAVEADADRILTESIQAWRCANRGLALPAVADKEALCKILDHVDTLRRRSGDIVARAQRLIADKGYVPLKLVVTGRDRFALYVEVPQGERVTIMPWRWVRRIGLEITKRGLSERGERLVWLRDTPDAKETELKRWEALQTWENSVPEPFRPKTLIAAEELVSRAIERTKTDFPGRGKGIPAARFRELTQEMLRHMRAGARNLVGQPRIAVPFGAYTFQQGDRIRLAYLVLYDNAENWLKHYASPAQVKELENSFVSVYKNKEHARNMFRDASLEPHIYAVFSRLESHGSGVYFCDEAVNTEHLHDASGEFDRESFQQRFHALDRRLENWVAMCPTLKRSKVLGYVINKAVWDGHHASLHEMFELAGPKK